MGQPTASTRRAGQGEGRGHRSPSGWGPAGAGPPLPRPRPTSGHLSHLCLRGVAPPPPAPHSGQGLCFLLFQVLSAEAQRFQHPKWDVALLGLECLLDGKAAWTRNHASIQLIPPLHDLFPPPPLIGCSGQSVHPPGFDTRLCVLRQVAQPL